MPDHRSDAAGLRTEAARLLGPLHPEVTLTAEPDGSWIAVASFEPLAEHRGKSGWLHGGLAATVLDHVCARAGGAAVGQPVVTGRFDLRYRAPVLLDAGPFAVRAVADPARSRTVRVSGSICTPAGQCLVEVRSLFVAVNA